MEHTFQPPEEILPLHGGGGRRGWLRYYRQLYNAPAGADSSLTFDHHRTRAWTFVGGDVYQPQIPTSFLVVPVGNGNQSRLTMTTELVGKSAAEGFVAKWVLQQVYRDEVELIAQVAEDSAAFRGSNPLGKTPSLSH